MLQTDYIYTTKKEEENVYSYVIKVDYIYVLKSLLIFCYIVKYFFRHESYFEILFIIH
jgi:hypothetical protein